MPGLVMGSDNQEPNIPLTKEEEQTIEEYRLECAKRIEERKKKYKLISEQCEKKEQEALCGICKEALEKFPSIGVHPEAEINHYFHVHCLCAWLNSSQKDDFKKKTIESQCIYCRKNYTLKTDDLEKKYAIYLETLPLGDKINDLGNLPFEIGRKALEEFAELTSEKRLEICKEGECDLAIQKFILRYYTNFFDELDWSYVKWPLDEGQNKKLSEILLTCKELLGERPLTVEFVTYLKLLTKEKAQSIFKKTAENAQYLLTDAEILEHNLSRSAYKFKQRTRLFREYLKFLTPDEQSEFFKKQIETTKDVSLKEIFSEIILKLNPKAREVCFDIAYPYLKKTDPRKLLKKHGSLIAQKKSDDFHHFFSKADGSYSELLIEYWDFLSEEEHFTIFSKIIRDCAKPVFLQQVSDKLNGETEQTKYFNETVYAVNHFLTFNHGFLRNEPEAKNEAEKILFNSLPDAFKAIWNKQVSKKLEGQTKQLRDNIIKALKINEPLPLEIRVPTEPKIQVQDSDIPKEQQSTLLSQSLLMGASVLWGSVIGGLHAYLSKSTFYQKHPRSVNLFAIPALLTLDLIGFSLINLVKTDNPNIMNPSEVYGSFALNLASIAAVKFAAGRTNKKILNQVSHTN